ncbi:MAG: L-threonylcarbamoyladenylate synthase [Bacteroidota bacterium]
MVDEVKKAAEVIRSGGVLLYPTDTIWGIGCDASNPQAVERIYQIKQRSDSKSMLVLMNDLSMLEEYVERVPEQALEILKLAKKPTTIIYPEGRHLAPNLLAEDGSIGIRITSDPFCKKLIETTGKPIVSTSANFSGEPPPDVYSKIEPGIKEAVDLVVNWKQDANNPSIPSAILRLNSNGTIKVLRP